MTNLPEASPLRPQSDPVSMYLVVNDSLNMGAGKIAAQTAHALMIFMPRFVELKDMFNSIWSSIESCNEVDQKEMENCLRPQLEEMEKVIDLTTDWLSADYRKIVLKANPAQWLKLKSEFKDRMIVVVDNGWTEVEPGSETVICLYPMLKSEAQKTIIKRLQALK